MSRSGWIASIAMAAALAVGCVALAENREDKGHEKKELALKDLPAAVQETILKAAASNAVYGFEKEEESGKTTYEAHFKVENVEHTVSVSDAGTLLEEEIAMEVKSLPAPVAEAIAKRYGTAATIKEAEAVKAGDKSFIDVAVVAGKELHEIRLDLAGTILSDVVEPEHPDRKADRDEEDEDGGRHGNKHKGHEEDEEHDQHDKPGKGEHKH
jgi:hypothetical protein